MFFCINWKFHHLHSGSWCVLLYWFGCIGLEFCERYPHTPYTLMILYMYCIFLFEKLNFYMDLSSRITLAVGNISWAHELYIMLITCLGHNFHNFISENAGYQPGPLWYLFTWIWYFVVTGTCQVFEVQLSVYSG